MRYIHFFYTFIHTSVNKKVKKVFLGVKID